MPTLTIIVPVFNTEKYLERCIDSILNQTFKELEVILINDGSTDSSGQICDDYAKKDLRVKVIHQSNKGQSIARKNGLVIAKGNYIGFIDSDDWISPYMYEILINAIKSTGSDVASVKTKVVKKEIYQKKININSNHQLIYNEKIIIDYLSKGLNDSANEYTLTNKIYTKKILKEEYFNVKNHSEDYVINFKIFSKIKKLVKIDFIGYFYFQRKGSTINNYLSKKDFSLFENCNLVINESKNFNNKLITDLAQIKLIRSYFSLLARARLRGISKDLNKEDIYFLEQNFLENFKTLLKAKMSITRKFVVIVIFFLIKFKIPYRKH